MHEWFGHFARATAQAVGSVPAFIAAFALIVGWLVTGPLFHFSDTWQLVINTTTTIITFLMVFLIQNTQNRETRALHLKIDELLRAVRSARTSFVTLEEMSDKDLDHVHDEFEMMGGAGTHSLSATPRRSADKRTSGDAGASQ